MSPTWEAYSMPSSFSSESSEEGLLEVQIECIHTNNQSLQTQYEQMVQNQEHLEEQERIYKHNQQHTALLEKEIKEQYETLNHLQQQVYYHRRELDRLADQTVMYEGVLQRQQKTMKEQEAEIENNHRVLAYDRQLVQGLRQAFQHAPYANEVMTLALSNY